MARDTYQYWQDEDNELARRNKAYSDPSKLWGGVTEASQAPLSEYGTLPGQGTDNGNISKFVNFDRILSANAGAAKNMAGRVSDRVEKAGEAAKSQITNLEKDFGTQVGQGTLQHNGILAPPKPETGQFGSDSYTITNPDTGIQQRKQSLGGTPQKGAGATMAPAEQTQDTTQTRGTFGQPRGLGQLDLQVAAGTPGFDENIDLAEAQRRAQQTYQGPKSLLDLQNYDTAAAAVDKAKTEAAQVGEQGGLQALLEDEYGKDKQYTQGMGKFDAALTGAAGGQRFADLKRKYGGLDALLGQALTKSADTGRQAAINTADAARQYQTDIDEYNKALGVIEDKTKAESDRIAQSDASGVTTRTKADNPYVEWSGRDYADKYPPEATGGFNENTYNKLTSSELVELLRMRDEADRLGRETRWSIDGAERQRMEDAFNAVRAYMSELAAKYGS